MKAVSIWMLVLAAMLMTVPVSAEEINAPEPHWNDSTATGTPVASATPVSAATADAIAPATTPELSLHEKAEEQIKEQEKQRVMGLVPSFNVTYNGSDTAPLTAGQKLRLAFHSATDPVAFGVAFVTAGYREATNGVSGFPWGPKGYFERSGAAYLDSFNGTMLGNGILPALLHQDPRFYRLGHGSITHRLLYAASTSLICKHDSGKWEPNYSNMAGNIIAGGISNLYYPGSNSGVGLTISNGMIQTAEGSIGGVVEEFWPDVSRRLFHKDPTHGRDAQVAAASGQTGN